jgi:hypothetical protein
LGLAGRHECTVPVAVQATEEIRCGPVTVGSQQLHDVGGAQRPIGVVADAIADNPLGVPRQSKIVIETDPAEIRRRLAMVVQPTLLLQAQE